MCLFYYVLALAQVLHLSDIRAAIDLSWSTDLSIGVFFPLKPVSNPSGEPSHGEHTGEHIGGNAHAAEYESCVEVDIGIQAPLLEIIICKCDILQFKGKLKEWIGMSILCHDLFTESLGNLGSWIVRLVDPVAESHEQEGIVLILILHFLDDILRCPSICMCVLKHLNYSLISSTVLESPECADSSRYRCIQIGFTACYESHSGGGTVLFVVCVENQ